MNFKLRNHGAFSDFSPTTLPIKQGGKPTTLPIKINLRRQLCQNKLLNRQLCQYNFNTFFYDFRGYFREEKQLK